MTVVTLVTVVTVETVVSREKNPTTFPHNKIKQPLLLFYRKIMHYLPTYIPIYVTVVTVVTVVTEVKVVTVVSSDL